MSNQTPRSFKIGELIEAKDGGKHLWAGWHESSVRPGYADVKLDGSFFAIVIDDEIVTMENFHFIRVLTPKGPLWISVRVFSDRRD